MKAAFPVPLRFLSDPGHGWLEVPSATLAPLGILDKVSAYSYLSADGAWAYLEEDCDAGLWLEAAGLGSAGAAERAGLIREFCEPHNDSFVRGLPGFDPARVPVHGSVVVRFVDTAWGAP